MFLFLEGTQRVGDAVAGRSSALSTHATPAKADWLPPSILLHATLQLLRSSWQHTHRRGGRGHDDGEAGARGGHGMIDGYGEGAHPGGGEVGRAPGGSRDTRQNSSSYHLKSLRSAATIGKIHPPFSPPLEKITPSLAQEWIGWNRRKRMVEIQSICWLIGWLALVVGWGFHVCLSKWTKCLI